VSRAAEQAGIQRAEAKRLLGQFIVDQAVADRIVDCIIGAAMLEITAVMCGPIRQHGAAPDGAASDSKGGV
jgi:hypothetical protein